MDCNPLSKYRNRVCPTSYEMAWDIPCFLSSIRVAVVRTLPRTDRCFNRYALKIENPEKAYAFEASFPLENFRATAAAFPQSFCPLRCLSGKRIYTDSTLRPMDLEEDIPETNSPSKVLAKTSLYKLCATFIFPTI